MTLAIDTIKAIAADYDVIVFDQWGVLHNGSAPYPAAINAVSDLPAKVAVLSNSGKRAAPNLARIAAMGFPPEVFDHVMTSGEALWRDIAEGHIPASRMFPVERDAGDAARWGEGLALELTHDDQEADAILMMGLPDQARLEDWTPLLKNWLGRGLPMYCSNPDRQSPRADGLVISPGALAHAFSDMGGQTSFYGKPHRPVFQALEKVLGSGRYLMVGDSMEHDIKGAQDAGWDALLVEGGLYAKRFAEGDAAAVLADIAQKNKCDPPTYRIRELS